MYAQEIKGSWFESKLPKTCRAFDCRGETIKHNGISLYACEKAAADLGLLEGYEYTTPESSSGWMDLREHEEQAAKAVARAIETFKKYRRLFLQAKRMHNNTAGSVYHEPIGICLSNFGWSVICSRKTSYTMPFKTMKY